MGLKISQGPVSSRATILSSVSKAGLTAPLCNSRAAAEQDFNSEGQTTSLRGKNARGEQTPGWEACVLVGSTFTLCIFREMEKNSRNKKGN